MLTEFLSKLNSNPEAVDFKDTIAVIQQHYHYTPAQFSNGLGENVVTNDAGSNEGSCKIFAFAKLNALSERQTLSCFGDYYRKDVLQHPEASDHANIRNFIKDGWPGISFETDALKSLE